MNDLPPVTWKAINMNEYEINSLWDIWGAINPLDSHLEDAWYAMERARYSWWNYLSDVLGEANPVLAA